MSTAAVTPNPDTDIQTGVSDQSTYSPETHSRTVAYPSGHVVAFPDSLDDGDFQKAAKASWEQLKQAGSALSTDLGGPELTKQGITDYAKNTVTAAKHPFESIKSAGAATAQMLGHPSDENLLTQAKAAYDQKDYLTAGRKFVNYAIPFIGAGSDRSSESLLKGEYGAGISHALVAAMPLILGAGGEASPITSELEASQAAAKQATISTRPNVPVSSVRVGIKSQFAKGGEINPNEHTVPVPQRTEGTPTTTAAERAGPIKAPQPMTEAERAAAVTIRRQYANEPTPLVKGAEPNVGGTILRGSEAEQAIHDFINSAYGKGAKSGVQSSVGEAGAIDTPQKSLVGPAPVKPSLGQLLSSERGELTIPGTSPAPPDVPTFYSKAEKVANEKVSNTASGDQVLATLRNNGVKENEIGWMGLDDYLKGKPKVSKADLQQFIKENQIQLEESTRGSQREQLQTQRDKLYAEQNLLWEKLQYPTDNGITIGQWLRSADEAKAEAIHTGNIPPQKLSQFQRFDDLGKQLADLDMKKATLQEQPTKYQQYTLPGPKENYKELLLKLPDQPSAEWQQVFDTREKVSDQMTALRKQEQHMLPDSDEYQRSARNYRELEKRFDSLDRQLGDLNPPIFRGSHFEDKNVLAHVRFDDRPVLDGKKTLFLEEVQSDWHQQGKKAGYQTPAPTADDIDLKFVPSKVPAGHDPGNYPGYWESFDKRDGEMITRHPGNMNQAQAMKDSLTFGKIKSGQGVPQAPFKSDWHELVMKRMLRHAAENGYDRIAWTTGDQQAARYDLSKQVDEIHYNPEAQRLTANKDGDRIIDKQVKPEQLADYIGKEPAQKLMKAEPNVNGLRSLKGDDLKVGGEWAKSLYDRAIPNFLRSYIKKWGGEVGTTQLKDAVGVNERYDLTETSGGWRPVDKEQNQGNGTFIGPVFKTGGAAEKWLKDQGYLNQTVHSIDITPAMKKAVMKIGQPIARTDAPHQFDWQSAVMNG